MNRDLHRLAAWFFAGVLVVWLAAMAFVLTTAQQPSEGRVAVVFPPVDQARKPFLKKPASHPLHR